MRRTLNKISMVVVATTVFCATLFLSMKSNEQGELEFATLSAFAQGDGG